MISNKEIFDRVVNLIDDPDISRAYYSDTIRFQKIMYPFLMNGVSIITAPTGVCELLAQREDPSGQLEVLDGNGSETYLLSTTPAVGADMAFYIGSEKDDGATYDATLNQVTFSKPVEEGTNCSIEWYAGGAFTGDFGKLNGKMPLDSLVQRVKDLLARATVIAWADKEKNFLLDIRNLLTDTDFRIYSPANSLKSKMDWVSNLRREIFNLQNKLDWDLRNQNRSYYGY